MTDSPSSLPKSSDRINSNETEPLAYAPVSLFLVSLLTLLVAIGPLTTDLYLPSLPALKQSFNTNTSAVQWTLSGYMFSFAFCQLIHGALSDRFGRRPILIIGMLVYIAASVACALALMIEHLILARLMQALGACCGPVLGRAIVRDLYPPERGARILAFLAAVMAIVPGIAPIFGGWFFIEYGWQSNFILLAFFGALILALIWWYMPETNHSLDQTATQPRRMIHNWGILLRHRLYVGFMLVNIGAFTGLFAFVSGSSFVLIEYLAVAPENFGWLFGLIVIGFISGSLTAAILTPRLNQSVQIGSFCTFFGGMLMLGLELASVHTIASVIGPQMLFMFGAGMVLPNAMAGAIGPFPHMAGAASALIGFAQMTGAAIAGAAVGSLLVDTALPMAVCIAIGGCLSLGSVFLVLRPITQEKM